MKLHLKSMRLGHTTLTNNYWQLCTHRACHDGAATAAVREVRVRIRLHSHSRSSTFIAYPTYQKSTDRAVAPGPWRPAKRCCGCWATRALREPRFCRCHNSLFRIRLRKRARVSRVRMCAWCSLKGSRQTYTQTSQHIMLYIIEYVARI